MAVAARDLARLADSTELPFLGRACLNWAGESRFKKELLSQKHRSGRIAILIGCIHRQARQWRKRFDGRPLLLREVRAIDSRRLAGAVFLLRGFMRGLSVGTIPRCEYKCHC